mgnify:CR=1 FL=1
MGDLHIKRPPASNVLHGGWATGLDYVVCPWCGLGFEDLALDDGMILHKCPSCRRDFIIKTDTVKIYAVKRVKRDEASG